MATSGTIGNTRFNTAKMLEKAIRRIGLAPQVLTPEIVETAKEDLFLLIMGMIDRGLNLWLIDDQIISLETYKKLYVLPEGTLDVLNLIYATPYRLDYQETYDANDTTVVFDSPTPVVSLGMMFSTLPTAPVEFQASQDGVTWYTVKTIAVSELPAADRYGWYKFETTPYASRYRAHSTDLGVMEDFFLASTIREINITPFNRDDYASQPNKDFASLTVTNYYFEKLIDPQITLWPVPATDQSYLHLYRYRQVQDVGSLTNEIEIPARWYDAITWELAARMAFEIPNVDPARRAEVVQMAEAMTKQTEAGETDSAPTYLYPNIRGYTR